MQIKIWDNGGKTADRYTVMIKYSNKPRETFYFTMSSDVGSPQGVNMFAGNDDTIKPSGHGKRIPWLSVSPKVRKAILDLLHISDE